MKSDTYVLLGLALGLLSACSPPLKVAEKVTRVDTYTLPVADNQVIREFNAIARAQDLTRLSFRVGGRIAAIPVTQGQVVKRGELLAVLDKKDFQIALSEHQARLEATDKQAQRTRQMVEGKLMAQAEFDQINAQYLVDSAVTRQAELNLQYTELRAPFDGVVSDILLESFENVQPGVPVLKMHKNERIDVEVQVPDILLAVSRRGEQGARLQSYDVSFDAFPGVVFEGKVLEMNSEKDPGTFTYLATLAVTLDKEYRVLEGMPAKVRANLSNLTYTYKRQYLVPIEAVLMKDGGSITEQTAGVWLYQPDTGTVTYKQVQLGVIVGDKIEVTSGLSDGLMLVTRGGARLIEGQRVEPNQ